MELSLCKAFLLFASFLAAQGAGHEQHACSIDEDLVADTFQANVTPAVWTPTVCAVIFIVLLSMPLCCGVKVDMFRGANAGRKKQLAAVTIVLSIIFMVSPMLGTMTTCGTITDEVCSNCDHECTDKEREDIQAGCSALFTIGVYIGYFGWLTLALSIVMSALGCCFCCDCCKLKEDPKAAEAGPPTVVGQPVVEAVPAQA